ncbi:MAG TPA: acyl-CoA desaturase [Burkholderiales bacterium]|nr:acyl-CoA desaturase [Burkholderiales bacterium]
MTTLEQGERLHRELLAELSAAGCFRRAPGRSAAFGTAILVIYAGAYALLLTAPALPLRLLAIAILAFLCVQAGFLAHEAGHGALTNNRRLASLVGQVFNTLITGMCYAYFQSIHRVHHPHCNERARDPDMQSEILSMYAESAHAKRGFGRLVTRRQGVLVWILIWLQGLSLKLDSLRFVARNLRTTRADQLVLVAHAALWAAPAAFVGLGDAWLNYSLMTLLIGGYTGAIFIVNHIGTRVMEPAESLPFMLHEIAVTRNLGTSRLEDFLFGGLNNHIEHHVFPSMPTVRLRTARRITREFCRRHGIDYREMSWLAAMREVGRHFKSMSRYARAPLAAPLH